MKNIKFIYLKITLLLGFIFTVIVGCERNPSSDLEFATFPNNGEVFIDGFSGGLEYLPFADSKFTAFTVDSKESYSGSASMRFDVPNYGDPAGAYAGAIFRDASGRDLSGYDALTFWAKASQAATIDQIGFGQDFGENKYLVTKKDLRLSTNWTKFVIPIPNASKLLAERGMFWYAEGPENDNGYTFWVDELKFEKLGTIAQPQPKIFNGEDKVQQTFLDVQNVISGLTQTFNLASGINQTVDVAPSYFTFNSSNTDVAQVNEKGVVTMVGTGTAKITAILNGVKAKGSLTVEVMGSFNFAPTPTQDPNNVVSIFSNAYTNVPVEYYNGYYAPYQTTLGQDDLNINGDDIIKYTNLNFVGIQFSKPTIDVSAMTYLHMDILVQQPNPIGANDVIKVQLADFGADATFGGGDDSSGLVTYPASTFVNDQWVSLDIPLSNFTGLTNKDNMAQILLDTTVNNQPTITSILVDNIYFYK